MVFTFCKTYDSVTTHLRSGKQVKYFLVIPRMATCFIRGEFRMFNVREVIRLHSNESVAIDRLIRSAGIPPCDRDHGHVSQGMVYLGALVWQ